VDYFCLERKTPSYQNGVSITLTPEFHPPYHMESMGELNYFSERGICGIKGYPESCSG